MKTVKFSINPVEFAKALADETRQKIMALCCCEWISVNEIVGKLDVAQPTVSHHLKILKNAGLVKSKRQGKQIMYTIDQARIADGCCRVANDFAPDKNIILKVDIPE